MAPSGADGWEWRHRPGPASTLPSAREAQSGVLHTEECVCEYLSSAPEGFYLCNFGPSTESIKKETDLWVGSGVELSKDLPHLVITGFMLI